MTNENGYNGWKNYQTWNVNVCLTNDYNLYLFAKKFKSYARLVEALQARGITRTDDGIRYADKRVSRREMNEMLREL